MVCQGCEAAILFNFLLSMNFGFYSYHRNIPTHGLSSLDMFHNEETIDAITSKNIILFKQTEIADEIKKILAELGAFYICDDLLWQYLEESRKVL